MRLIAILFLFLSCSKSNTQTIQGFEDRPETISIKNGNVPEASGMADSRTHPGYLWVQQDSGNPPLIYLVGHDGTVTDSVLVEQAVNRDWEDMTLMNGQLYIADIGDNNAQYPDYTIYRFDEPSMAEERVTDPDKIRFRYPDGSHDAEALLVDAATNDIYIITKRDAKSRVYKLPFPQDVSGLSEAVFVTELDFSGTVSAAMSPDGKEIIVKTYTRLYLYTKKAADPVDEALKKAPSTLGYQVEAQGEAVSFGIDNSGFYTLSEEAMGIVPALNFYKRR